MATQPEISAPVASGKTEATLGDIIDHLRVHRPGADLNLIRRAYVYAEQAHRDCPIVQKTSLRASKRRYPFRSGSKTVPPGRGGGGGGWG